MSNALLEKLRHMILSGELTEGERLTEMAMAERLGVSRTPIRSVLPLLAADGLLDTVGKRGFAVRRFDPKECLETLELRVLLEAAAAKKLAVLGLSNKVESQLRQALEDGDRLFAKGHLEAADESLYADMNVRFHSLIVEHCGSAPLIATLEKINHAPLVAPSVLLFDEVGLESAYTHLFWAHGQHHALFEALLARDGERAEAIFKEHGHVQKASLLKKLNLREG